MGDAADWLTESMSDPESQAEQEAWDDSYPDENDAPPIKCRVIRTPSVIDQLRAMYPGYWTFSRKTGPTWTNGTITIRSYSKLSPKYDGDDESCISVYFDDKGNQVGACGIIWSK